MELITPETVQAIQTALAPVAEKIGQGATFAWDVVVQQQYVIGVAKLIWTVPFVGLAIVFVVLSRLAFKEDRKQDEKSYRNDGGFAVLGVFLAILSIVMTLVAFGFITSGIMHVLNPNYYALEFFITLGKSAVQ